MKLEQTADGSYTLMYPNWTNIIIRLKRGDGVTTYFYQNGIKVFPFPSPHIWRGLGAGAVMPFRLLSAEETDGKVHYTGIERYPSSRRNLEDWTTA